MVAVGPLQAACAQEAADAQPAAMQGDLPDDAEIFAAAGFRKVGEGWSKCDDPGTASYEPGAILQRDDMNGDGLTDAFVTEGSSYCFGATGYGYTLVSRQADGAWRVMDENTGIPTALATRGVDGWPDIELGGPGFCLAVLRWNGQEYRLDRHAYQGQPCNP